MPDQNVNAAVAEYQRLREQDSSALLNQQQILDRNQNLRAGVDLQRDPDASRPPDYYLNVFSISPLEHVRYRPPDFPVIKLAACPKDKPWALVFRIPDVVRAKWMNTDTGQLQTKGDRGERWATDLLNPANITENQWIATNPEMDHFFGSEDLVRRGLFWSRNAEPTAEELRMSRERMEKHFRSEVQKADELAREGNLKLISGEQHAAAEYLGLNSIWHVRTQVPIACPNCGESISPNAAFHASGAGVLCVIDWKRTVEAGAKTRDQVPEEKRWWDEPKPQRKA